MTYTCSKKMGRCGKNQDNTSRSGSRLNNHYSQVYLVQSQKVKRWFSSIADNIKARLTSPTDDTYFTNFLKVILLVKSGRAATFLIKMITLGIIIYGLRETEYYPYKADVIEKDYLSDKEYFKQNKSKYTARFINLIRPNTYIYDNLLIVMPRVL